MIDNIQIPDEAYRYILYQRTAYLASPGRLWYRLARKVAPNAAFNAAVRLESSRRQSEIARAFRDDMAAEYATFADHLPNRCQRVLDIGCGVAGIDLFLFEHYRRPANLEFILLDKTSVDAKVYYRFEARGSFYNSLAAARELLAANGVRRHAVTLLEADDDARIDTAPGVDLAVSLISWGFHYPIDVYLERVWELLSPGGRVIVDVRNGTDGESKLADRFGGCTPIHTTRKLKRVLAVKQE